MQQVVAYGVIAEEARTLRFATNSQKVETICRRRGNVVSQQRIGFAGFRIRMIPVNSELV